MAQTMKEAKQTFKTLENSCKLLQQQQITFISALERTREAAHDRIRPVRSLEQVRRYLDNHCTNLTDKRILSQFLDTCAALGDFCVKLEALDSENKSAGCSFEELITLLSPANDLSALRAKYPHDVVNHLSCDEAKNFYGGIVSLLPIVLDKIRQALAKMEKPKTQPCDLGTRAGQSFNKHNDRKLGDFSDKQTTGVQTSVSEGDSSLQMTKAKSYVNSMKPAWRPPGRFYTR